MFWQACAKMSDWLTPHVAVHYRRPGRYAWRIVSQVQARQKACASGHFEANVAAQIERSTYVIASRQANSSTTARGGRVDSPLDGAGCEGVARFSAKILGCEGEPGSLPGPEAGR
jgi:hypothetical protein